MMRWIRRERAVEIGAHGLAHADAEQLDVARNGARARSRSSAREILAHVIRVHAVRELRGSGSRTSAVPPVGEQPRDRAQVAARGRPGARSPGSSPPRRSGARATAAPRCSARQNAAPAARLAASGATRSTPSARAAAAREQRRCRTRCRSRGRARARPRSARRANSYAARWRARSTPKSATIVVEALAGEAAFASRAGGSARPASASRVSSRAKHSPIAGAQR